VGYITGILPVKRFLRARFGFHIIFAKYFVSLSFLPFPHAAFLIIKCGSVQMTSKAQCARLCVGLNKFLCRFLNLQFAMCDFYSTALLYPYAYPRPCLRLSFGRAYEEIRKQHICFSSCILHSRRGNG
jgi:hypothetical protein